MDNEKNILAIRIKQLRNELDLTQEDLALQLGLKGKSSVANYESGKIVPSDKIKLKMCEIFGCSMDYLIGKSDYKNFDDYIEHNIDDVADVINNLASVYEYIAQQGNSKAISILKKNNDEKLIEELIILKPSEKKLNDMLDKYVECIQEPIRSQYKDTLLNMYNIAIAKDIDDNQISDKLCEESDEYRYDDKIYMTPVYNQSSVGQPNWAEECIEGRIPVDPNLMGIKNAEEHFFLRISDESMNKIVKNGAFALIHKQDTVENGEIAVVLVNRF